MTKNRQPSSGSRFKFSWRRRKPQSIDYSASKLVVVNYNNPDVQAFSVLDEALLMLRSFTASNTHAVLVAIGEDNSARTVAEVRAVFTDSRHQVLLTNLDSGETETVFEGAPLFSMSGG